MKGVKIKQPIYSRYDNNLEVLTKRHANECDVIMLRNQ